MEELHNTDANICIVRTTLLLLRNMLLLEPCLLLMPRVAIETNQLKVFALKCLLDSCLWTEKIRNLLQRYCRSTQGGLASLKHVSCVSTTALVFPELSYVPRSSNKSLFKRHIGESQPHMQALKHVAESYN